jgi:hypothetical protein
MVYNTQSYWAPYLLFTKVLCVLQIIMAVIVIIVFSTTGTNTSVMVFGEFSSYRYLLAILILTVGNLNTCHWGGLQCESPISSFMKSRQLVQKIKGHMQKRPAFFP